MHDDVAVAQAEHEREEGDELLRADGGQHGCRVEPVDPAATREPLHDRVAERGRAHARGTRARRSPGRARRARRRGWGRPVSRSRGRRGRRDAPGRVPDRAPSGPRGSRAALRAPSSVRLRRQRGDDRVVLRDHADLRGAAGRAQVVEDSRWPCSSPSTVVGGRPRSRSPRPGRPARRRRSRRTRRGGCRASVHPRRCSRPGTRRCRRCP